MIQFKSFKAMTMIGLTYVFVGVCLTTVVLARPEIDARIVGGYAAQDGQFPYAAALFVNVTGTDFASLCSGTLISPSYILTAAHCLSEAQEVRVVLGNARLNVTSPYEVRLTLNKKHFIIPKSYSANVYDWDIALLKLPGALDLNDYIQPVKLAEGSKTYAGETGVITGWGTTYQGQVTIEQQLRYAQNVILSNEACRREHTYFLFVQDNHLCQSAIGSRGVCHGDNGGTLVVEGVAVGIVSVGPGNCFRELPVVYTRISSFISWIKDNSDV